MKKSVLYILMTAALVLLLSAVVHAAEIAVIVNKNNANDVSRDVVEKIYKGELNQWKGGGAITILDLPEDSPDRAAFTSQLLGKTVPGMKAVWAVKLFSGKATPPKVMDSDEAVRRAVAGNPHAIGYVKASSVNDSVKVVLTLK